ncbi:MAG: hypothetical protein Q9195_005358 [Heterodermia aff. obscurata]
MVEHMFNYLYGVEYNPINLEIASRDKKCELLTHTALYILAEKYDIPDLKQEALSAFRKSIVLLTAKDVKWDNSTFLEVVRDTLPFLPSSDKGLLSEFLHVLTKEISELPILPNITNAEAVSAIAEAKGRNRVDIWQPVLVSNPEFTVSLLREVVAQNGGRGAANREVFKQLTNMTIGLMNTQILSKKVARTFLDKLNQMKFEASE